MKRARNAVAALVASAAVLMGPTVAQTATPSSGTMNVSSNGSANVLHWTGTVHPGTETGAQDQGTGCFGSDNKPADTTLTGCDFFTLNVNVPSNFYKHFIGGTRVKMSNFNGGSAAPDLDFYIYKRNPDGSADLDNIVGSGATESDPEQYTIPKGEGSFYIVVVPFATGPTQSYDGEVRLFVKHRLSIAEVNRRAPRGAKNYRASHDRFNSHSEPTIAMDPLNHKHLIAGSKMYQNLAKYLFKIGTYESYDGGKHWRDYGQLPGYCTAPGYCNPKDLNRYRVVSDVSMTMDDEGNGYAFVLDAVGGASNAHGWNMNVHIKKPHKNWSKPIVVHNNRANEVTNTVFLDDKNWIAIDNNHTPDGGPNKKHDHKIGPLYTCWGLDQGDTPPIPSVGQSIVFMRSDDGGHTWGGAQPGDNAPLVLSQQGVISGIGCHIIVDKAGNIYVTWYDNLAGALMQVKSIDFGHSFTPATPIATINGQDTPFPGQAFRNLSIPTTGVDGKGNVYVAVDSRNGEGAPVVGPAQRAARDLYAKGKLDKQALRQILEEFGQRIQPEEAAGGDPPTCPTDDPDTTPCTDVILFKSTDGGVTYSGPVRVNQDSRKSPADQFQPWMAITPKGQIDISYFDRRNDPNNFYIDTYLSRSNDGGTHWKDTRASHSVWDPEINPPISPSGQFIGDYQGIVADDRVAIPFWNDTQYANLRKSAKKYSPFQEVSAARIPNTGAKGGPKCLDRKAPRTKLRRKSIRFKNRRFVAHGRSHDRGCRGKLKRVNVSVAMLKGHKCRFLKKNRHFTRKRSCRKRVLLRAEGKRRWRFKSGRKLPRGRYRVIATARDRAGNRERPKKGRNTVTFRLR